MYFNFHVHISPAESTADFCPVQYSCCTYIHTIRNPPYNLVVFNLSSLSFPSPLSPPQFLNSSALNQSQDLPFD